MLRPQRRYGSFFEILISFGVGREHITREGCMHPIFHLKCCLALCNLLTPSMRKVRGSGKKIVFIFCIRLRALHLLPNMIYCISRCRMCHTSPTYEPQVKRHRGKETHRCPDRCTPSSYFDSGVVDSLVSLVP